MRGLTSTIILVLVLAGLGAYIYFVDSKKPAGGLEEKQKVFTVEADKINEVTVTAENETTSLKKENGTWKFLKRAIITEPPPAPPAAAPSTR